MKDHLVKGKFTSGMAAVMAIFSFLGLQGDAATVEWIHQWISLNGAQIANIIGVIMLLFANDPEVLTKPKNNDQVMKETKERLDGLESLLERLAANPTKERG